MDRSTGRLARTALAAWLLVGAAAGVAAAQNSVGVPGAAVDPGETGAVLPIEASTADPVTLLSVDLSFDRSLCDLIQGASVEKAGRTKVDVQEGGIRCPEEGRIRVVVFNLTGQAVLPPGEGEIARLVFDVTPGARGSFPVAVTVNQASNGPAHVPFSTASGVLSIGAAPACPGDCDGDGRTTVAELVAAVNMALAGTSGGSCPAADADLDGTVTVDELVLAVQSGLAGCP